MTSIHTNASSMAAMATLRQLTTSMVRAQDSVATGMRVSEASHNAAYWSISTTMRSDARSIGTVQDALGLTMAKLDVSYAAMTKAIDVASEIKARLVAATANPASAGAIQTEIRELVAQARTQAESAMFAGAKWLSTDIEDIREADAELRTVSMMSSYTRSASGLIETGTIDFDLRATSLFNVGGGGIFEADPRSPRTIGGIRNVTATGGFSTTNLRNGSQAGIAFDFNGPVDLSGGGKVEFDLTVDADNPGDGLPPPLHPGSKKSIEITQALVEAVVPGSGGVIADYRQMAAVLSAALDGKDAYVTLLRDIHGEIIPDRYAIWSSETSGLNGSALSITNLTESVGGLTNNVQSFGTRGNSLSISFLPFKIYESVEISFDFGLNGATQSYGLTREFVDGVLGNDDGEVKGAADMKALLDALIGQPGLVIEANGATDLTIRSDSSDRLNGQKSRIGFSGIKVNVEPIAAFGLEDIDVEANYDLLPAYIAAVDAMVWKATDGAALLGAMKTRVENQRDFASKLLDSINRGISQLVDTDMEKASTRLRALEVQTQLATQALSIANAAPRAMLHLFARQVA